MLNYDKKIGFLLRNFNAHDKIAHINPINSVMDKTVTVTLIYIT